MPTVRELSALYESLMLAPVHGPGVCSTCLTFTDGYARCYTCANGEERLDTVAPISYSIAGEQLHHALAGYKRLTGDMGRRLQLQLTAVLWRYLELHERCIAGALGIERFELVTTVPSRMRLRKPEHPLQQMVAELCGVTRERHRRLLERSDTEDSEHAFDADRYKPLARLERQAVLLIDDTWTTGANAQSAAAALKRAGAGPVAVVVIGRHLKRDWRENDNRIRRLTTPFNWSACVHCADAGSVASTAGSHR